MLGTVLIFHVNLVYEQSPDRFVLYMNSKKQKQLTNYFKIKKV